MATIRELDDPLTLYLRKQGFAEPRIGRTPGTPLVEYLVTERLGIHVGYDWFRLKLGNDYTGSFDAPPESGVGTVDVAGRLTGQFKVHGPMAGVTFRF